MSTNFPSKLDTTNTLPNIVDIVTPTILTEEVFPTDTVIYVKSTDFYPLRDGLIVIGNEQIVYSEVTENSFVDCSRGFNGTAVSNHNVGASVLSYVTAAAYRNLRDAILQIQELIGANGGNIAVTDKSNQFSGSTQIFNGLLLTTPTNDGIDSWSLVPTNDGQNAVLNFVYEGSAAKNTLNIPTTTSNIAPPNIVSYSDSIVFDMSKSNSQVVTLTGNNVSSNIINATSGQFFTFKLYQDTVGNRVFVFPNNFKGVDGYIPSGTPNTGTVLLFWYDGTNAWMIGGQTGLI